MAALNFKYGLFSKLPVTQTPGTVYVTADEGAMYVDLPAVGEGESRIDAHRVRLSSTIIIDSGRTPEPPYNPEAIYYFVDGNALLRWNPTGGDDGTGAWVQINSLTQVQDNIDAVVERVAANETAITVLQQSDTRIEGLITAETSRASAKENELAGLIGDENGGLTKELADEISRATTKENELAGLIGNNSTAITTLQSKDTELSNSINSLEQNKLDKSTYESKITELSGLIANNTTAAQNAQKAADDAQADADANAGAITTLQTAVGDANSGLTKGLADANIAIKDLDDTKVELSDYNAKVSELNTAIAAAKKAGDDAQADADKNAEAITSIQDAIGENGLTKDIDDLDQRLTSAEGTITNHGTRLTTVEGKASANESAIAGHNTRLTTVEGKASANESAITNLQVTVGNSESGLVKGLADANTAITALDNKIGTIPTDSQATNVIDYINGQFEAANAMQYKEGIESLNDLPTTGVNAGDTYVVIADFYDLNKSESYYAGDLVIAAADQGDELSYHGEWTHVKTGYQASHDAQLSGAGNKIKLTSLAGAGVSLGEIEVSTTNSMITATVENNTLTLSLDWGTFD